MITPYQDLQGISSQDQVQTNYDQFNFSSNGTIDDFYFNDGQDDFEFLQFDEINGEVEQQQQQLDPNNCEDLVGVNFLEDRLLISSLPFQDPSSARIDHLQIDNAIALSEKNLSSGNVLEFDWDDIIARNDTLPHKNNNDIYQTMAYVLKLNIQSCEEEEKEPEEQQQQMSSQIIDLLPKLVSFQISQEINRQSFGEQQKQGQEEILHQSSASHFFNHSEEILSQTNTDAIEQDTQLIPGRANNRGQHHNPGKSFQFDLRNYISQPLQGYKVYASQKTEITNVRVLKKLCRTYSTLPHYQNNLDPLNLPELIDLDHFRILNNLTVADCLQSPEQQIKDSEAIDIDYTEDTEILIPTSKDRFQYDPNVRRMYLGKIDGIIGTVSEGLCPYCPEIKFGQLKNSNYGHHLCIKHGVQTNGVGIPSPTNHGLYYFEKLNKMNWTNVVFEGVFCPIEGCRTICKVSHVIKDQTYPQNRLLDYLRHYKKCHKSGRLLDLIKRNRTKMN